MEEEKEAVEQEQEHEVIKTEEEMEALPDISDEALEGDDSQDTDIGDIIDDFFEESAVEEDEPEPEPEPEPEQEVESEPEQEPEPDELEELRARNEALMQRVEELSSKVVGGIYKAPEEGTGGEEPPEQQPQQPPQQPTQPAEPPNFLEGYEVEDLLEDPKKLNDVLLRAVNYGQQQAVYQAQTQTLRTIPEMVLGYITRHTAMNRMVDEFYQENPDLSNVKQTVAAVANDIHSKNPDWAVDKVFQETAEQTRKLLGLKKAAQEKVTKPQTKKPAFAKSKGARREEPQIGGLQKEINDLLVDL